MDRPGPHGGFIRMPGRFHTEIRQEPDKTLSVFLLDEEFHEPLTGGSWVKGFIRRGEHENRLACQVEPADKRFRCRLPDGASLKDGDKVILDVQRKGTPPGRAVYNFPFKLLKG